MAFPKIFHGKMVRHHINDKSANKENQPSSQTLPSKTHKRSQSSLTNRLPLLSKSDLKLNLNSKDNQQKPGSKLPPTPELNSTPELPSKSNGSSIPPPPSELLIKKMKVKKSKSHNFLNKFIKKPNKQLLSTKSVGNLAYEAKTDGKDDHYAAETIFNDYEDSLVPVTDANFLKHSPDRQSFKKLAPISATSKTVSVAIDQPNMSISYNNDSFDDRPILDRMKSPSFDEKLKKNQIKQERDSKESNFSILDNYDNSDYILKNYKHKSNSFLGDLSSMDFDPIVKKLSLEESEPLITTNKNNTKSIESIAECSNEQSVDFKGSKDKNDTHPTIIKEDSINEIEPHPSITKVPESVRRIENPYGMIEKAFDKSSDHDKSYDKTTSIFYSSSDKFYTVNSGKMNSDDGFINENSISSEKVEPIEKSFEALDAKAEKSSFKSDNRRINLNGSFERLRKDTITPENNIYPDEEASITSLDKYDDVKDNSLTFDNCNMSHSTSRRESLVFQSLTNDNSERSEPYTEFETVKDVKYQVIKKNIDSGSNIKMISSSPAGSVDSVTSESPSPLLNSIKMANKSRQNDDDIEVDNSILDKQPIEDIQESSKISQTKNHSNNDSIDPFHSVASEVRENMSSVDYYCPANPSYSVPRDEVYRNEMLLLVERHTLMVNKKEEEVRHLKQLLEQERKMNSLLYSPIPRSREFSPTLPSSASFDDLTNSSKKIRKKFIPMDITLTSEQQPKPKNYCPLNSQNMHLLPPFELDKSKGMKTSTSLPKTLSETGDDEYFLKPLMTPRSTSRSPTVDSKEEFESQPSQRLPNETKIEFGGKLTASPSNNAANIYHNPNEYKPNEIHDNSVSLMQNGPSNTNKSPEKHLKFEEDSVDKTKTQKTTPVGISRSSTLTSTYHTADYNDSFLRELENASLDRQSLKNVAIVEKPNGENKRDFSGSTTISSVMSDSNKLFDSRTHDCNSSNSSEASYNDNYSDTLTKKPVAPVNKSPELNGLLL